MPTAGFPYTTQMKIFFYTMPLLAEGNRVVNGDFKVTVAPDHKSVSFEKITAYYVCDVNPSIRGDYQDILEATTDTVRLVLAKWRVLSAHVSSPNTPKSDAEPKVDHDVSVQTDTGVVTIRVYANDPLDAITVMQRALKYR